MAKWIRVSQVWPEAAVHISRLNQLGWFQWWGSHIRGSWRPLTTYFREQSWDAVPLDPWGHSSPLGCYQPCLSMVRYNAWPSCPIWGFSKGNLSLRTPHCLPETPLSELHFTLDSSYSILLPFFLSQGQICIVFDSFPCLFLRFSLSSSTGAFSQWLLCTWHPVLITSSWSPELIKIDFLYFQPKAFSLLLLSRKWIQLA